MGPFNEFCNAIRKSLLLNRDKLIVSLGLVTLCSPISPGSLGLGSGQAAKRKGAKMPAGVCL